MMTQYCLRRLRFLLIRILAAPIIIYCKHTAVTNITSESAIFETIDRSSEHHQIYRPTFLTDEKSTGVSEISSADKSADLWAGGAAALHNEISVRHRKLNPDRVAHLSTNWARLRLTSVIQANVLTTTPDHQTRGDRNGKGKRRGFCSPTDQ